MPSVYSVDLGIIPGIELTPSKRNKLVGVSLLVQRQLRSVKRPKFHFQQSRAPLDLTLCVTKATVKSALVALRIGIEPLNEAFCALYVAVLRLHTRKLRVSCITPSPIKLSTKSLRTEVFLTSAQRNDLSFFVNMLELVNSDVSHVVNIWKLCRQPLYS
jgi:hypothetical protein